MLSDLSLLHRLLVSLNHQTSPPLRWTHTSRHEGYVHLVHVPANLDYLPFRQRIKEPDAIILWALISKLGLGPSPFSTPSISCITVPSRHWHVLLNAIRALIQAIEHQERRGKPTALPMLLSILPTLPVANDILTGDQDHV
jgi:hypothetical protein